MFLCNVSFEVPTTVTVTMQIFWDITMFRENAGTPFSRSSSQWRIYLYIERRCIKWMLQIIPSSVSGLWKGLFTKLLFPHILPLFLHNTHMGFLL